MKIQKEEGVELENTEVAENDTCSFLLVRIGKIVYKLCISN